MQINANHFDGKIQQIWLLLLLLFTVSCWVPIGVDDGGGCGADGGPQGIGVEAISRSLLMARQ